MVIGVLFTEWLFTPAAALSFASAGVAFVSMILIFGTMARRGKLSAWTLLIGGPCYLVYLLAALFLPVAVPAGH